jgi:hypothetical protein
VPDLHSVADIATILTFLGAAFAYGRYMRDGHIHRIRLERYLRGEKSHDVPDGKKGLRTILQISRQLGLTEDQSLRASFGSNHVTRRVAINPGNGLADHLLFGIDC